MTPNLGYSEILQLTGTALLISGMPVAGWIFCALGLAGIALRFGLHVQEREAKKQEAEEFAKKVTDSGRAFLQAVSTAARNNDELH